MIIDTVLSNLNSCEQKTYPVHIIYTDCGYVRNELSLNEFAC